jgi:hypothetical protein
MPGALQPLDPLSGEPWYGKRAWAELRLSSKSHWDVPVRCPGGGELHLLCCHPTPPIFDGSEDRNGCRNHDEIRFWAEYLNGARWITDDQGRAGGLAEDAAFVILGDLNADPDEGDARNNPIGTHLLSHPRIQGDFVPTSTRPLPSGNRDLDADDTATWGLRVDYVLPSRGLRVMDGGVFRSNPKGAKPPSDHFLVWLDLMLPNGD